MMRVGALRIVVCFALLSCVAAFADTIVSSTPGAGWDSWTSAAVVSTNYGTGTPYWNGSSWDNAYDNIGNCLTDTGNCTSVGSGAPGALPYWGVSGAADPSFYFDRTSSSSTAAMEIELAGNWTVNSFGWYDVNNPRTSHVIFSGGTTVGSVSAPFTPTAQYGFWFTGAGDNGTYYTQSSYSQADQGIQHFAVFQGAGSTYWLGIEDLNFSNSDKDFQDMVVKVSPVPDSGLTLMLLGSALIGLQILRRKFQA